jgi:hypothetical protein
MTKRSGERGFHALDGALVDVVVERKPPYLEETKDIGPVWLVSKFFLLIFWQPIIFWSLFGWLLKFW